MVVIVLVLDTDVLPAHDRVDAFHAAVTENSAAIAASFEDRDTLRARMEVFDLGAAWVFTIKGSGTTLRRTPRMARTANDGSLVLALPMQSHNHFMWGREQRDFGPRDLILGDLSSPYVYHWPEHGASYAFHVDIDQLGLPMDTVHRAARELRASPLYTMVSDHIAHVTANAAALETSGARSSVGAASVELMHALIVSAAGDAQRTRESLHTSSATRVRAYVRRHLRDPDLSPARVAAANGLSVRALYKLYETLGTSLEQSIIDQRLRGAKADLSLPATQHLPIAAVARSWGFSNPSFFAQRFRWAFGVTPRQWRTAGGNPPPAADAGPRP